MGVESWSRGLCSMLFGKMLVDDNLGRMLAFDFSIPAWMPKSYVLPLPKPRWKLLARCQITKKLPTKMQKAECKRSAKTSWP